MAYVYRHIRLDKNIPFYIGIGSDATYKRAHEKTRRNAIWNKIVNKTAYDVEILIDDVPFSEAKIKETEFIKLYGRMDIKTGCLTNMTDGGDGTTNKVFSDEYKNKLRAAAKNRIISKEQRIKIADSRRGKKFTKEQCERVSIALSGRKLSDAHIESISNRMTYNNPMAGKTGIDCINIKHRVTAFKDGKLVGEYNGMYDCARELGLSATKINAVLKGRRNHTGGFTFKSKAIT